MRNLPQVTQRISGDPVHSLLVQNSLIHEAGEKQPFSQTHQGRAGQGRWLLLWVPPLRPMRCHSRTSWDRELMQLCGSGQCAGCWPGFCEPGHLVDKACVLVPKVILDTALIHFFLLPKRHFAVKKKKKSRGGQRRELTLGSSDLSINPLPARVGPEDSLWASSSVPILDWLPTLA